MPSNKEITWKVEYQNGEKVLKGTLADTTFQTVLYAEEGEKALSKAKEIIAKTFLHHIPRAKNLAA